MMCIWLDSRSCMRKMTKSGGDHSSSVVQASGTALCELSLQVGIVRYLLYRSLGNAHRLEGRLGLYFGARQVERVAARKAFHRAIAVLRLQDDRDAVVQLARP